MAPAFRLEPGLAGQAPDGKRWQVQTGGIVPRTKNKDKFAAAECQGKLADCPNFEWTAESRSPHLMSLQDGKPFKATPGFVPLSASSITFPVDTCTGPDQQACAVFRSNIMNGFSPTFSKRTPRSTKLWMRLGADQMRKPRRTVKCREYRFSQPDLGASGNCQPSFVSGRQPSPISISVSPVSLSILTFMPASGNGSSSYLDVRSAMRLASSTFIMPALGKWINRINSFWRRSA